MEVRIQNGMKKIILYNGPLLVILCVITSSTLQPRSAVSSLEDQGIVESFEELTPFIQFIGHNFKKILATVLSVPVLALGLAILFEQIRLR